MVRVVVRQGFYCMYVCLFIIDPVGPMIQQNLTTEYMYAFDTSIVKVYSITQYCVAHRPAVPPGQPDHICRLVVPSRSTYLPYSTNKYSACTLTLQPQNKRTTLSSQCAESNNASLGPECRTPTGRTVRVVLCNAAAVPSRRL